MKYINRLIALICFVTLSVPSWAQGSQMYDYIVQYQADKGALERKYTIKESDEYYQRIAKLYDGWLERLAELDYSTFSVNEQADYTMLKNLISKNQYFLNQEYDKFKEVKVVIKDMDALYEFMIQRRKGKVQDWKALAAAMTDISDGMADRKRTLKAKPFENWLVADKAARVIDALSGSLDEAYGFYYGYDPEFTWWMEKPFAALKAGLGDYQQFLVDNYQSGSLKDDGSGIIGKPIGKKAIKESLQFSMIPYEAEDLIEAAEEQFKYCEAEMLKASAELGFGKDWKAAMEYVKNTYVPVGKQPELIDSLALEAIDFVESRDLISVPEMAKETWRMIMMTPERQKVNPFFTGGEVISISYPTHTMDHDDKMMSMRGNNPNFSTATVHHELIPGHHMQQFMNSRYKPYRRLFYTAFWTEGWALYWEINLWNKGFPETPEERIGMLFWRMHRCARIIFSLSYHLEKMTPQQCIDMLVDRVGHEYANAEAEVRRSFTSGYDPLYQIAYMIGGLQFFALQKELLAAGWTEKQYHDAVMREGNIPIEILRAILKEETIDEHFKTEWKFSMDFK